MSGSSVTANDRTVVHRTSVGFSIGFPDVCLTPDRSGAPVPYANFAFSADAVDCCTTVFCDGNAVMKLSSSLYPTSGDEPGHGGGLISKCNQGKATFITHSADVRFEGEPAPRHLDIMGMNHMSPPNIYGVLVQLILKVGLRETLCIAFCACNHKFLKMKCFRPFFADKVSARPSFGFWLGGYWDPRFPGVWLEVPYDMSRKPPTMMHSDVDSTHQKDASGRPLKVPATWWQSRGSRLPDIVEAKDPTQPPIDESNIKNVYELKFDGDRAREGQLEDELAIAGNHQSRFHVLDAETCGCKKREKYDENVKRKERQSEVEALNQGPLRAWARAEHERQPQPVGPDTGYAANPRPGEFRRPGVHPGHKPGPVWTPVPKGVPPLPGGKVPLPGPVRPILPEIIPAFYAPPPSASSPILAGSSAAWTEGPMSMITAMESFT